MFPYLAHAPMEPNNCVIHRTDDGGVEMNFGSQIQTIDQGVAAAVLGLKPAQVKINTLLAGGSFGRRATPAGDMAAEAAEVSKGAQHKGPIKVLWTREDDIKGGRYRPIFVHRSRGGVDAQGNIVGWDQVIVGQSFMKGSPFESGMVQEWHRPDDGRRRQHAALSDSQLARVGAHDRGRRADAVVALGRLDAHGFLDRDVPRSAGRRGRHRSARHPAQAADQASAPSRRARSGGREGGLGKAARQRPLARPCGARSPSTPSSPTSSRCRWARTGCRRWNASW